MQALPTQMLPKNASVAARCSRLGSALKQNHTGALESASEAEDSVTYADYGVRILTSTVKMIGAW